MYTTVKITASVFSTLFTSSPNPFHLFDPGRDSPCSRTGREWRTGPPATRWSGRRGYPGRASKPTWDTTRRRTMRSAPLSPAHWNQLEEKHDPGTGHNLHGCASGHQTDGIGRTWPWAAVRSPGAEAHRRAAQGQAGHHHRNPMVPGT